MDANLKYGEKTWRQLHKKASSNIEQVLEAAPHKTAAVPPTTTHHENYPSYTNQTYGNCWRSGDELISDTLL